MRSRRCGPGLCSPAASSPRELGLQWLSLLLLAAMYFIAQWDRQGRPRDFYAAVAVAALALLTKATGYAAAATLVIVAALRLRSTRWSRASIQQLAAAILVLASAALVTASLRTSTYALTPCQRVLGHACDRPREPTPPAQPLDYLHVDLRGLVSPQNTLAHAPEHEYFLNRLARSSLFGVMPLGEDFASKRHETLAVLLRSLLLTMVLACAIMLPFVRRVTWPRYRALVLASALMLVMLAGFGFVLPNRFTTISATSSRSSSRVASCTPSWWSACAAGPRCCTRLASASDC